MSVVAGAKIDATMHRVDLPCTRLGFSPPPAPVHMRFVREASSWRLLVRSAPGRPPIISQWLRRHQPDAIHVGAGLAPSILHAEFSALPSEWLIWVEAVDVHHVDVTADGTASLFVRATPERLYQFLAWSRADQADIRDRPVLPGWRGSGLTPRQEDVLDLAVACGYYEIPHRVDLRELGQRLGVSVGAVASILRRAEAAVIRGYMDDRAQERWNAEGSGVEFPDANHVGVQTIGDDAKPPGRTRPATVRHLPRRRHVALPRHPFAG